LEDTPLVISDDALLTAEDVSALSFIFDATEVVGRVAEIISGFFDSPSDLELTSAEESATAMPANDDAAVFIASSGINGGG
jgi:hypothetical protein